MSTSLFADEKSSRTIDPKNPYGLDMICIGKLRFNFLQMLFYGFKSRHIYKDNTRGALPISKLKLQLN
jgi:hypothetical protein